MRVLCFSLIVFTFACTHNVDLPTDVQAAMQTLPDQVDYNLHIKPILSDRCFKCHGPDKNKIEAGLQLATFQGATLSLESGATAISPGNISKSEMVRRIITHDQEEIMPPADSHLTLSAEEKALLIKWIDQGAEYKEHWSLTKIEQPDVPEIGKSWFVRKGWSDDEESEWTKNEIDHFTLSMMKQKGFTQSPQADKATLLRRAYMDLTGLPPTPGEVMSFLKDSSPDAYEKIVDRLLASPHFGEQQAVSWLDLARYADTHGYQDDGMRNVYPYRDWVIAAFNQNLSFDKFVTYQLAGDLLPSPSKDMMIATSFNRQHPQTQEGGVVFEEYLTEYVADRTNTFGKAFLGLTVECSRCHDHKYDPISTKDYYSLFAFFNQNKEHGEVPYNGEAAPTIMLPTEEVDKKIKYIQQQISTTQKSIQQDETKYESGFEQYMKAATTHPVDELILKKDLLADVDFDGENDPYKNTVANDMILAPSGDHDRRPLPVKGKFGNAVQLRGDCGLQLAGDIDRTAKTNPEKYYKGIHFERNQPFSLSFWFNTLKKGNAGPLITKNNGEFEGYRGYDIHLNADGTLTATMMHVYPSNGIEIRTHEKIVDNQWYQVALTYDGSASAQGFKLFLNGRESKVRVITDHLTKSILHGVQNTNWSFGGFEIGKDFRSTIDNICFDELKVYGRRLSQLEIEALFVNASTVSLHADRSKLYDFYRWNYDASFLQQQEKLKALRLEEVVVVTDVPEVMVMQELPEDQRRKTFVLNRGVYDSPGEEVVAETPLNIGKLPKDYPRNRLGLSKWLLDENNPLFARVMVNRIWMQYFGMGLVKTQEDFGNQGDLPTHPALLDWLAIQFRNDGWDFKKFTKRIVMSATYQQSSKADAASIEKDPENKWLSRGPSYRFSAEQVRDNALAASGLLTRKIGGPSVYPYQPGGIWEALATRNAVTYTQQHGEDLYRRSMYTIWKRSSPPPMMLNFDAPDRQLCTARRQRTATPLQALVTLNDPQFVEAARVLAERTITIHNNDADRLKNIFLATISREPRPAELKIMHELLETQRNHYRQQPDEAIKLLQVAEYSRDEKLDPQEVAAYTVVANTILNYDEALVKR